MPRFQNPLPAALGLFFVAGGLTLGIALPAHAQLGASLDRRYDQNFYLTAHAAFANRQEGYIVANQDVSLERQLDDGVRALDLRVFAMAQGSCGPFSLPSFIIYGEDGPHYYAPLGCDASAFHDMGPLQAVTAHHPELVQYAFNLGSRFNSLKSELDRVVGWLRGHPDQVVTLFTSMDFGRTRYRYLVDQAFQQSGADQYVFHPDRDNVGMPAPAGQEGWWNVQRHGWPALRAMAAANRRLVLDPTSVGTVCCDDSINAARWSNADGTPIDDFSYSLFTIQQTPSPPTILFNGYATLQRKLGDILQRWNRLPNFIWLDFYQGPVGEPYRFVSDVNAMWAQPQGAFQAALPSITPAPNGNGWINATTPVTVSGFGGTIAGQPLRRLVWSVSHLVPGAGGPSTVIDQSSTTAAWAPRSFNGEGITTISYAGIDAQGRRSDQQFLNIRIDRTPPQISFTGNKGSYAVDETIDISVRATDSLSGVASVTPPNIKVEAGDYSPGRNSIGVRATDNSGNASLADATFTVVVTYDSLGSLTRRWYAPGSGLEAASFHLKEAEKAAAAGDAAGKAANIAAYQSLIPESGIAQGLYTREHREKLLQFSQAL
jgi:hypothetical protein